MSRRTKKRLSISFELILIAVLVLSGVTLPPQPARADSYVFSVLVVGGGGGGGASQDTEGGAGGGAGGYRETTLSMDEGLHAITVGAGGAGGTAGSAGTDGGDSLISTLLTSDGGGGGGGTADKNGHAGGSGGGGSAQTSGGGTGGSATGGQGNDGGSGGDTGEGGGGGGGAGAVGSAGSSTGGAGGSGTASSISGSSTTYAGGGGGGGSSSSSGGAGGSGGGGGGGAGPSSNGTGGTANTGGGGGGGAGSNGDGAAGGSGVVIIRYLTSDLSIGIGGTKTTDGLYTVHTFTTSGTFSFALSAAVDPPLTGMSDTLSVSTPASASNHTIVFTVPGGVPAGGSFSLDFQDPDTAASVFATGSVDFSDIDVASAGGDYTLATCGGQSGLTWGVCISGSEIHFQSGTSSVDTGATLTIEIGTNATTGTTGDQQLINPPAISGTRISFDTFDLTDTSIGQGSTYVAIVEQVTLSATIDDTFVFVVDGCTSAGTCQIDGFTVEADSTATLANFGTLAPEDPVTMGSSLSITSNAINGFVVTLEQNHNMLASNGADIDSFVDGTGGVGNEAAWASPAGTNGLENTYGHLGIHSEDNSDTAVAWTASVSAESDGTWVGFDGTTAIEVWDYDGVGDGTTQDIGHIDVGYRVEISGLQESGVYTNQVMYIATPTF